MPLDYNDCIIKKNGVPERLNVAKTVSWIKQSTPIATVMKTKEILHYSKGIYISEGEQYVSRILAEAFGSINKYSDAPIYNKSVKSEILTMLRDTTYTGMEEFDKDLNIINMTNGLYDISSGEFRFHDPAYLSRLQIPVVFDVDARCPVIEEVFKVLVKPEDLDKIYEFIGYTLWRTYEIQEIVLPPWSWWHRQILLSRCS